MNVEMKLREFLTEQFLWLNGCQVLPVADGIEVSHTTIYHNDNRKSSGFELNRIEPILRNLQFKNRTLNSEGMRHPRQLPAIFLDGWYGSLLFCD